MGIRPLARSIGFLCIGLGAAAVTVGTGCSTNSSGFQDALAAQGAAPGLDGAARIDAVGGATVDARGTSPGGGGGSIGNPGIDSSMISPPVDAPIVPQSTGGAADASRGGTSGSIGATGGIAGTAGATGGTIAAGIDGGARDARDAGPSGTGGSARDAGRDGAVDGQVDAPAGTACTSASACPNPTSGNGTAVCQNGVCGITCNGGFHRCGDTCTSNTSTRSCGTSCSPCADPAAGASVSCSGNPLACVYGCATGYHACGNTCVANGSTDPNSCGNSCTVCTAPANGSVTCDGTGCVLACNSNYHPCGSTCVANNSTSSCGTTSCAACPHPANSTATCNGSPLACGLTCDSSYHLCGASCASNTSTTSCGAACTACPNDPHGRTTCDGTNCGIACNTGYHKCNGHCVSNNSTDTCGNTDNTSCTPCPTAVGATATCTGNPPVCGLDYTCSAGNHQCGGTCVPYGTTQCTTNANGTCGACPAAPSGSHYHAICDQGQCGFACDNGYHDCGGDSGLSCVSNSDPQNCGDSCGTNCSAPSNATAACNGSACAITCDKDYHLCNSDSECLSDTNVNSCGTRCVPCPNPSDGNTTHVTCAGGKCGFDCNDNYHWCGTGDSSICQPNGDTRYCGNGADCKSCAVGWTCVGGQCEPPPDGGG